MQHEAKPKNSGKQVKGWSNLLAVVVIFVVFIGGWFGLIYLLGTESPVTVVDGTSMYPTLKKGDLVIIKGASEDELIKDFKNAKTYMDRPIIVFYSPSGKRIIHRIYSLKYDGNGNFLGFITKGDNNPTPDPYLVNTNKIIGKVIFGPIHYLGLIVLFIRSPFGFSVVAFSIIILAVWIVIDEVNKYLKKSKGKENSNSLYNG